MKHAWPELEYEKWKPTYETLHRWVQIVGKLRLCKSPCSNHSWNSALYVTSRGLTTSAIPLGERNLTVSFDFHDHQLQFEDSNGVSFVMPLLSETVASFYQRFMEALKIFDVSTHFSLSPNEVMDSTPFDKDTTHSTYNPVDAHNCFQALVRASNIMQEFRVGFIGKSSPVHFFWGSFDLALTRFSGRVAPEHPGGIPHLSNDVVREAYSHEVMSVGFWPGNDMYPRPAFYAYAYPEPQGFSDMRLNVNGAFYHENMHEFILDYDLVRKSANPQEMVMSFFQNAYEATSHLAHWDNELNAGQALKNLTTIFQSSFGGEATRQ